MKPGLNICFHGIGTPGRQLEEGEDEVWISEELFTLVLDEIMTWPEIRITFDDGNASDIEIAMDALLSRGLRATFFVVAGRFDTAGSLSRDNVRNLRRAGMTIGTHGMHHRSWRHLDEVGRQVELVEARAQIAEASGAPVREAAAPLGSYDRRVLSTLKALDYTHLHTSDRRTARPQDWLQPRFSVRTNDTPEGLRAEIVEPQPTARQLWLEAKGLIKRLR